MTTETLSSLHQSNIILHITAGSIALIAGIIILTTSKGGRFHRNAGKIFLILLAIVIFTGLVGVFVFKRNSFLLVITVLSGYLGYSGYRTLKTRSNQPKITDIGIALLSVLSVCYFLYYFKSIGMIWAPSIIYSTLGYLIVVVTYDLGRYFIPVPFYANLWRYEHILKMISAFSGLLSAFTGTVFPQYQPYSQFLPSVFGALVAIGFMIAAYRKQGAL